MFNDIVIGPITIHMYGVMIAAGFLAALLMTLRRGKKEAMMRISSGAFSSAAIIGGMLGTRILYYIVEIPEIMKDPSILWDFKERLCGLWRNHRRNSGKLYLLPHEKAGVYAVF